MALTMDFFLLGLNDPVVDAWFRGMYNSFFEALEELGCRVTYSDVQPNQDADVLVVPMGGGQDKSSAQAMQTFRGPVILYVGAASEWFRPGFLERWRDRLLFVYGCDCSEFSPKMYAELGISYYHLPFASNPAVMRPLGLPKLYDVVFVGNAGSGFGRHNYVEPLMKAVGNRKVSFIGPGWQRYGFPSQSIAWSELLNLVYNLGQICINISTDEQKIGMGQRLDANNRLFDLAMAGCFQVSNAPQVVRRYFNEAEVVAVDPPEEWVATILYYLDHPAETEPYRLAARQRAMAEHTWKHRGGQFLAMIEPHLATWQRPRRPASLWTGIARLRDTTLPPYGMDEACAKVRRKINLVWKRS